MIKGSLQMKILYRGVFVEDFVWKWAKIDGFGGIRQGKLWVSKFRPP